MIQLYVIGMAFGIQTQLIIRDFSAADKGTGQKKGKQLL